MSAENLVTVRKMCRSEKMGQSLTNVSVEKCVTVINCVTVRKMCHS